MYKRRHVKHHGSNGIRLYYLLITLLLASIVLFLSLQYTSSRFSASNLSSLPNLNISDLGFVLKNYSYTISGTGLTKFNGNITEYGYISSNESIFNVSSTNSMPVGSILSSLILTSSPADAANVTNNLIFSNNAGQKVNVYKYEIDGKVINIYNVFSVAVANLSGINYNATYSMPIFQYTSIFSYGKYVGVIVASWYKGDISKNMTLLLAEKLAEKVISKS